MYLSGKENLLKYSLRMKVQQLRFKHMLAMRVLVLEEVF